MRYFLAILMVGAILGFCLGCEKEPSRNEPAYSRPGPVDPPVRRAPASPPPRYGNIRTVDDNAAPPPPVAPPARRPVSSSPRKPDTLTGATGGDVPETISPPPTRDEPEVYEEPQPATQTYTVQKGDSYWKIAKKLLGAGSRWREIADLNPDVKPTKIQIGQELIVPAN